MYGRQDDYDWQVKLMPPDCEVGNMGVMLDGLKISVFFMMFILISQQYKFKIVEKKS